MKFLRQSSRVPVLIFAHPNRVNFIFFVFLYIVQGSNRERYLCFSSFYRHYRGGCDKAELSLMGLVNVVEKPGANCGTAILIEILFLTSFFFVMLTFLFHIILR